MEGRKEGRKGGREKRRKKRGKEEKKEGRRNEVVCVTIELQTDRTRHATVGLLGLFQRNPPLTYLYFRIHCHLANEFKNFLTVGNEDG